MEKLAIIGMDAAFGAFRTLDALERSIHCGTQHFVPFPSHRCQDAKDWQRSSLCSDVESGDRPEGAYLDRADIDLFGFAARSSDLLEFSPSQKLLLEVAEAALKDAGIGRGKTVAILISAEHQPMVPIAPDRDDRAYVDAIAKTLAQRIAARWGLTCPDFTLIAGESSTFKALELAQTLLHSAQADAVLIGAVDLLDGIEPNPVRSATAATDPGARTLSYDRNARSVAPGEGAGAVVLKRLDKARADRDRIYAAIETIACVQGSATARSEAIAQVCRIAFEQADIKPEQIGYVEVVGSGIEAEDIAEIRGLTAAYRTTSPQLSCAVGSVKANIGHTRTASGIASAIKTALCLYHQYLPVTPQWTAPKQPELWESSPFYIPTRSRLWLIPPNASRRTAAINGIGQDNSYAHILLSEEPSAKDLRSPYLEQMPLHLFPLAGGDRSALLAQLETLSAAVENADSLTQAASQAFDRFRQQSQAPYAIAILGRDKAEICREIQRAQTGIPQAFDKGSEWKTPLGSYFSPNPQGQRGGVAFVYPGAFTSYMGLIDSINRLFPRVMDSLAVFNASDRMRQLMDIATQEVYPRTREKLTARQMEQLELKLQDDATTMLLFGTGAAVFFTTILREYFRLEPQSVFGYSLGEFSMMYALQVWSSADEIAERLHRSPLFKTRLSGPKETVREFWGLPLEETPHQKEFWGTYVLLAEPTAVREAIAAHQESASEPKVYLTHINTPTEVVVAGDDEACQRVIKALNCDYFPAPSKHVLHCEAMSSEFSELSDWFTLPLQPVPQLSFYTAATYGQTCLDSSAIAKSIAQALCQPLDFPRLIRQVYDDGARVFIELGPGGTCSRWIRETLKQEDHAAITFNTRGVDDHTSTLRALAKLVSHRVSLDLACLYEPLAQPHPIPEKILVEAGTSGRQSSPGLPSPRKPSLPPKFPVRGDLVFRTPARQSTKQVHAKTSNFSTAGAPSVSTETLTKASENLHSSLHSPPRPPNSGGRSTQDFGFLPPELGSHFRGRVPRLEESGVGWGGQCNASGHRHPHASFLDLRQESLRQMGQLIERQMATAKTLLLDAPPAPNPSPTVLRPAQSPAVLDEAAVLEFATGTLASVFGPSYGEADTYPKRLRLPMPPYLFVSRVTQLHAERGRFEPCSIETEYDIPADAWYAVDGRVPASIFVEAYQSIILLLSYLGVDFEAKGAQAFRALDTTLEFLGDPPRAGETFRCWVRIRSFTRSSGMLLCFYDCEYFAGDSYAPRVRKFLTVQAGAGMFPEQTLKKSAGISLPKLALAARKNPQKPQFTPLLTCPKVSFHERDLLRLGTGDLAACFGETYAASQQQNPSLRLPASAFRAIDRILAVSPKGGTWGLGMLVAEKDLHPEHWYFNCHFKDDYCMPGTAIGEGAMQLLQFYGLFLGLQVRTRQGQFRPIPHLIQTTRSRGQVVPLHGKLIYQLEVFEIGLEPTPFLKAKAFVKLRDKTIASIENLGVQL
ncbi:PfaB family protein [Altericista sp. CCNU0014]|uniref:PfaB family protein n=1 Tax=Altericista sp. CCNU0014 TaxID=3082949 RepID=UPI00384AF968